MALSKIELLAGLLEIVVIERRRHFSIFRSRDAKGGGFAAPSSYRLDDLRNDCFCVIGGQAEEQRDA